MYDIVIDFKNRTITSYPNDKNHEEDSANYGEIYIKKELNLSLEQHNKFIKKILTTCFFKKYDFELIYHS